MQNLSWVGGHNNRANNPNDWSPGFAPQPGDTLQVGGPDVPGGSYTMNIKGNDLAGDALTNTDSTLTANISNHAVVTASVGFGNAIYNVSGGSSLTTTVSHATATVSLVGNSSLTINPGYGSTTVNVAGTDTVTILPVSGPANVSINLAAGAHLQGILTTPDLGLSVKGAAGSKFVNNGTSTFGGPPTRLGVDVTGTGTITVATLNTSLITGDQLEFMGSVGAHQTVSDGARILIDTPTSFAGMMELTSQYSIVDLQGLAAADSFTFKNDLLSIYSGSSVIDRMHLTDQTPFGFDIAKTAAGDVSIVALNTPGQTGALPAHA